MADPSSSEPSLTYRDAGVDIDAGNALVERIKSVSQATLRPEVLMFNWGLHSRFPAGSTPVVPGQHGDPAAYAANLEKITQKLVVWAGNETKLLFAVTSPSKTVAPSRFGRCLPSR